MYPDNPTPLSALFAGQGLELESERIEVDVLLLGLRSTRPRAPCPACGHDARRVHSRYQRTLSDLPWGGLAARPLVRVRRFRWERAGCERALFAERLPAPAGSQPYAARAGPSAARSAAARVYVSGQSVTAA